MQDPDLATRFDSEADLAPQAPTLVWDPSAIPAGRTPIEPAQAAHAISTPGPNAPGRATQPESTEHVADHRAIQTPLPPIPGYEVTHFLGRGGMGVVYRARHVPTGRVVALKLINPGAASDHTSRERFEREIHSLARLKHPNIVSVYDAGDWHGFPYCTMEFVAGGTLNQHLDRIRTDLRVAVRLMAKVARAVDALHLAGVLHRDLKPLNILLDENDEPMVADFGLAKWIDDESDLTYTGMPIGTRQYMAPEQTLGRSRSNNPACDIWALGVTLYELLSGHRPFRDDGINDVYHSIRTQAPQPLELLAPEVPAELHAIIGKSLAKKPEDRYATAAAFADDLERWLRGEPVSVASRPTVSPVPRTDVENPRRRRVLLTGVAVVAIAFVLAAIVGGGKPPQAEPTLLDRVNAGEKVKLTDEKGKPTQPWMPTEGHQLFEKEAGGFHAFTTRGGGIAEFANEKWELPIQVEADVAVPFNTSCPLGGVYVGRRPWVGAPVKHESLVWFGVIPRTAPPVPAGNAGREIGRVAELYWWERDQRGEATTFEEKRGPWDRNGKAEQPYFARVVIEIRETELRATVDGVALTPIRERAVFDALTAGAKARPQFPNFQFTQPIFGGGIGVFCQNSDCIVCNLTITKLKP